MVMKSFIALRHDVRAVALGLLLPLMSWSAGHAQSLCSADAASIPATATSASMDEFALYLRFNRIIEESNIFLTAQDSFTASFTSFMEKYFSKIARTPEDALAVETVMTAMKTASAATEIANFIAAYWHARVPTKVALFYATLNKGDKPGNHAWLLPKGEDRLLHVYIIPTTQNLPVLTPEGLAEALAARIGAAVPRAVNKLLYAEIVRDVVKRSIQAGFEASRGVFLSSKVTDHGFEIDQIWRDTPERTYQFPPASFAGMEIGDIKIICLYQAAPAKILSERVASNRILFHGESSGIVRL